MVKEKKNLFKKRTILAVVALFLLLIIIIAITNESYNKPEKQPQINTNDTVESNDTLVNLVLSEEGGFLPGIPDWLVIGAIAFVIWKMMEGCRRSRY